MTQQRKVLIVGIGNIEREDDGIGALAAQRIGQLHPEWEILIVRQLLPEMVTLLNATDRLIFVDAAVDVPPGEVQSTQIQIRDEFPASHQLTPAELLSLALLADIPVPSAWCVRVGIERLGFGVTLSAAALSALERAVQEIEQIGSGSDTANVLRASATT